MKAFSHERSSHYDEYNYIPTILFKKSIDVSKINRIKVTYRITNVFKTTGTKDWTLSFFVRFHSLSGQKPFFEQGDEKGFTDVIYSITQSRDFAPTIPPDTVDNFFEFDLSQYRDPNGTYSYSHKLEGVGQAALRMGTRLGYGEGMSFEASCDIKIYKIEFFA